MPINIAEMDQSFALLTNEFPPHLFAFFNKCKGAGFSEKEALAMTVALLQSLVGGGAASE